MRSPILDDAAMTANCLVDAMRGKAVAAAVVAGIAAYLPASLTQKLPAAMAWLVPGAAMVVAVGLMINMYFFR